MAYAAGAKILKDAGEQATDCEKQLSAALVEVENNAAADLKAVLKELYFKSAKEFEVGSGRKAIVLFVPFPQVKSWQKIHQKVVRELEKKFSGKHIVILAQRRILPKPTRKTRNQKQKRPFSRTLTNVHDKILEDLCYPAEIVGRRTRVRLDASRLHKVQLDKNQQTEVEHKLDTYTSVYKKLTGKEVVFDFPEQLNGPLEMALVSADKFQHILRVQNTNIDGQRNIQFAMTAIKGIGRRFSNIICKKADIDITKRAGQLDDEEIKRMETIMLNPRQYKVPDYFLNRQKDAKDGTFTQVISNGLETKLREDLERMKKIRCHRGLRHYWMLRVRGQHTKTTGRRGRTVGVSKKK